ncbi:ribonuclease H-like domain-containing protein [Tanacetum coccineum]|uniref:Ribonuclease H-like domain-containing protein n=1 Tax=Tanacetum coccineum TaxID=301880 RepID=A0ABQ4X1R5_9ASTR
MGGRFTSAKDDRGRTKEMTKRKERKEVALIEEAYYQNELRRYHNKRSNHSTYKENSTVGIKSLLEVTADKLMLLVYNLLLLVFRVNAASTKVTTAQRLRLLKEFLLEVRSIKSRFGGNDKSKKVQKYILKQQYEGFSVSNSKGLHKGYERFQRLLSQLEIHGAGVSTKDANQKFLRSLPSAWSQVSLIIRTKPGVDSLSFDDLYNNLRDGRRSGKQEDSKALVTIDGEGIDWTSHSEEEEDYALMACNSSGSDTEVNSCSNECKESYAKLKKLYDAQREQLSNASIEIKAYTQGLKKVEAQLVAHQQGQLWYEEKIRFMKIDLDDKTDVLTYHKKLLAEAQKEKEDLKAKVEKWHNSSKNLGKLLNTQMSANDKFGLGYGDHRYDGILSYENEVLQSVFMNKESELEKQPLYDRFVTAGGMHAVPPPMTGNYMPSGPDVEIDYSQFTYGPNQSQPSESETQTSDFDTCESDCSVETHESLPEPTVNEPKVVNQPKVWSDAPIIEEYESDSEDEHRMAKQAELNNSMRKKSSQREIRPIWNNVQRVYHKNQFVPTAVLTRTGKILVNTARASGTNNVSTARHDFNRQAVLTNVARKISTVKPFVNKVRPKTVFHKTHSPFRRPFNNTTALKTTFTKQKVNTAGVNSVSAVGGKRETAVKPSAGCNWRPQSHHIWQNDYPHRALQNKGIVDSGCSRHMTGNKAYLAEYQDFNGGPVAFGGSKGYITGKGKIKTGKLDFEDVCFVKELQHFNLFSVSQMCDKKKEPKVLFTDSECLVLSPEFKLPDENQVLLRIPRQNNMYSFNLENIVPSGGLACLIAKATIDESNKWHRRLGHVNFKNLNKLVKGNLVRGLPLKIFQNDHTCVACQKGKQHKASCKAKSVRLNQSFLTASHLDFDWTYFEFKNRDFIELCGSKGIKREYSNARTPQQNGVAERKNKTLIEAARTMLADSFLPNTFWAESISIMFLIWEGQLWLFDLDYLTDSMNYQPVRSENQANKHAGPQEANHNAGTQDNIDAGDSEKEDESAQDYFVLPIWSSYSSTVKRSTAKDAGEAPNKHPDLKTDEKPVDKEDQVFLDELKRLKEPVMNVSHIPTSRINSIHPSTFILGDPQSAVQTRSKVTKSSRAHAFVSYIPNAKGENNHKDFPAFVYLLVSLSQNEPKKSLKYLKMKVGLCYAEEIAAVLKFQKVVDSFCKHFAFLYGKIDEEVYVSQPPGFIDPQYPKKVYKVVKALYGLHQAPRAWYATLSTFLLKNGYRRGTIDKTLFIKKDKHDIILVQVYMDDIIFGSTKKSWCDDFEALMKSRFQMSSMGELTFFLGLQSQTKEDGIFLSSDNLACSRFQVTPKTSHLSVVKRIFRHMTGNKAYLAEYQDFNGGPVAFGGSKGYITGKGKNPVYHSKTKHIAIRYHFIRDAYEKKLIQVLKIHTNDNVADLLTKAFDYTEAFLTIGDEFQEVHWVSRVLGKRYRWYCNIAVAKLVQFFIGTSKFDGKSDEGFLVGYSLQSKAFRVYNLETKRVEENLHITFLENKPNVAGKGPTWLFDLDYLTDSMNYQPIRSENQANKHADCSVETHESLPDPTVNEPKVVNQPKVWFDAPIIEEYELDSEDEHVSQPTKEQEQPSFSSTNKQVKTPRETVKNQFTYSKNPTVDKKGLRFGFTARACFVCGSLSHLIRNCDFHEKRKAKQAELNNSMRMKSSQREIRPIWNNVQGVNHKNQFVPTAVLTRTGKIPVNTTRASGTNNVSTARHKFNRQAVPTNDAMKVHTVKPIVNRVRPANVNTTEVNAVSAVGGKRKTVVKPSAVKQKEDGIFISQDKYVAEILKKFDFVSVKTASTPIETQKPLVKDEEASDVDVHLYRSMIGSLMYLTASRPDIMYLKGKPKLGLWYPRVSSFDLEAYSDSDYAGANLDRKSTTGGCQFLGRRLISWQCKKQTIVATSTTEAEYVAAANCCGQVLWIQNQMLDYGFNFMNTKIYIDNESTICIVKNPVYHSKTKHIAIRHHFIRDAYEKKLIQVLKIHTNNVADLLTKAFDVSRFQFLVVTIGMINP